MKILLMGRKQVTANLLEWSLKEGHEVVGILTDSQFEASPTAKIARINNIKIYSLEDIYDNYDLCSIIVKEWAEDFYTSFSAKKFISILNYEK